MRVLGSFGMLVRTLLVVAVVLAAKIALHAAGLEPIESSPLHASIVAGGIFILSVFLTGILPDYKEAERLPSDFTATVDNMYEDVVAIAATHPSFDPRPITNVLRAALAAFRDDITRNERKAYGQLHQLSAALNGMEAAGVPPPFIVKLKQEQGM